jgi:hypothetical protein
MSRDVRTVCLDFPESLSARRTDGTGAAPPLRELLGGLRRCVNTHVAASKMRGALIDKLGFLVRFWELRTRHATSGEPLSANEQLELLSLMQLVTGDFKMPPAGKSTRPPNALPAQLIGQGSILAVELHHVCAAALVVASATSIKQGERVIVRAADAVNGVEFSLPCSIAWVCRGSPFLMAAVVDGIPVRADLAALPALRGANALSMGARVRLVS